jgi:hypothetical protein
MYWINSELPKIFYKIFIWLVWGYVTRFPIINPMQNLELGVPPRIGTPNSLDHLESLFTHKLNRQKMSTTQTQTAPVTKTLDEMIADNIAAASKSTSRVEVVIVKSVTNWTPTNKGNLPRKMVITDKGNYWVLASSITNLPSSFTQPVQATAVLKPNGQYTNMVRLEFAGLETAILLSIQAMQPGTALFATSAGVKLAV